MLIGNHPAKVDEKGRLKIPAEFRSYLEQTFGPEVFVTSVEGESALIYPLKVWEAIRDKLKQVPAMDPSRQRYDQRTNYFGQVGAMDKQGRILIHSTLRDSAATAGEVAVLGKDNHLEVWNRERFLRKLESQPFSVEDMNRLASYGI